MGTHPTASITWADALAWRMERHFLDPIGSDSVADVVRRLGAVLSMDESLAERAVRTRRTASRPGELAQALADGEVINAFAFRGAMHYLSPEEGGVYLALRAAGRQWELPSWVEYYRLRPADWPDFRAAVRDALRDGPLTYAELGEAQRGSTSHGQWAPVLRTLGARAKRQEPVESTVPTRATLKVRSDACEAIGCRHARERSS